MSNSVFENVYEYEKQFADFDGGGTQTAQGGLWVVNDRLYDDQTKRFRGNCSPLHEMVAEAGTPILGDMHVPKGLVDFLKIKFLPHLNIRESKVVALETVVDNVLRFLDWQEPYFFLIDMPVSLTEGNVLRTYKDKRTGNILDPSKIEVFEVQRGWNFPHYTYVHKILTDKRTSMVVNGHDVLMPDGSRYMGIYDILCSISSSVYGTWQHLEGCLYEWMDYVYEDLKYDVLKTSGPEQLNEIECAEENDVPFWAAVTLGIMTWMKSPHGLKYLIGYHPVYSSVLEWNYETNSPRIADNSGGWAVISGWTIYNAYDLDVLTTAPGTCCVSQQPLHCTQLVNAKAVLKDCGCGHPRNIFTSDYWEEHQHRLASCKNWERENPPQMAFISYAALENILKQQDPKTPCSRLTCPMLSCYYHAGKQAHIWALTEQRTKMLTAPRGHC